MSKQGILITNAQGMDDAACEKIAEHYGKSVVLHGWDASVEIPEHVIAFVKHDIPTPIPYETALKAANGQEEVTEEPHFCVDCAYYIPGTKPSRAKCKSPQSISSDLVLGEGNLCITERMRYGNCTPAGRNFLRQVANLAADAL